MKTNSENRLPKMTVRDAGKHFDGAKNLLSHQIIILEQLPICTGPSPYTFMPNCLH